MTPRTRTNHATLSAAYPTTGEAYDEALDKLIADAVEAVIPTVKPGPATEWLLSLTDKLAAPSPDSYEPDIGDIHDLADSIADLVAGDCERSEFVIEIDADPVEGLDERVKWLSAGGYGWYVSRFTAEGRHFIHCEREARYEPAAWEEK